MSRLVGLLILTVACLSAPPSFAAESDTIHGIWKLVSYEVEVQATGQIGPVMGEKPTGHAAFLPEGRVFFVLTGEARKPGKTDKERADLLSTLVAYTGTYRIEGDTWLQVLTPWRLMPNWADKGMTRSIVTFERSQ